MLRVKRAGSLTVIVKARNQLFCNLPPQLPLYSLNENRINVEDPDFELMSPSRYLTLLLALVLGGSFSQVNGQGWTMTSAPITNWVSVACSADGQRLIAAVNNNFPPLGGLIYVSTDGGVNWKQTSAPWTNWTCVASSGDGTKLVAAGNYTPVYFSLDGGATWGNSTNISPWRSVSCSSDGTTMVAAGNDFPMVASGSCFSTNSGATWSLGNGGPWLATATSADGSKLVIAGHFYIYQHGLDSEVLVSTNHGASWVDATNAPALPWTSVSLSSDGRKLIAVATGGGAVSADFGETWTVLSTPNVPWTSLAASKDANRLVATGNPSPLYTSPDAGTTWISNNAPVTSWSGVASSEDGNTLFAVAYDGGIYTWHAPTVLPGTVLWIYDEGVVIYSSPVLSRDGTIYVSIPDTLCAITNTGSVASNKWTFHAANARVSAAVGPDGTVYQASSDGNLYAVNPDGSTRWSVPVGSGGSPAIGRNNMVYLQGGSSLCAITPTGSIQWTNFVGTGPNSPVIGSDGTIYAGSYGANRLYAFNPDGTQRWFRDLPNNIGDSPALGTDGTIYVTASALFAFGPDGTQLWGTLTNTFFGASPVVGYGGAIYVRDSNHILTAIAPSSQVLWQAVQDYQTFAPPTAPAIDSSGTIYYCAQNSLWALNPRGQVLWSVLGSSPPGTAAATTSPTVGPDGTVYVALGTKLMAVAGASTGPANSSWPMFRQNPRHTGKIERPTLSQPQTRTDSNFTFQLYPNQIGLTYTVESSTNLRAWSTVTNIVATTLPTEVMDFSASNAPTKFYRAWESGQ